MSLKARTWLVRGLVLLCAGGAGAGEDPARWSQAEFDARVRAAAAYNPRSTEVASEIDPPDVPDTLRINTMCAELVEIRAQSMQHQPDWYPTLCIPSQASQPATAPGPASIERKPGSGGESATDLAKQAQNPIADLISVPFQNNLGFGAGAKYQLGLRPRALLGLGGRKRAGFTIRTSDDNEPQNVMNFQPVIPVEVTPDWNLINRIILPVVYQPEVIPGAGDQFGLGNMQYTAFLSPAKSRELIWGVGPVFLFPTNTSDALGTDNWSVGPSVVVLTIQDRWVIGALGQQLFSYAGDQGSQAVSQMLIQPFINYNFDKGWYLTTAPIITANWVADSDNQWTVPLGGGFGRVVRIGKLPVNLQLAAYYNVAKPDFAPDWTLRFQVQLLFPK